MERRDLKNIRQRISALKPEFDTAKAIVARGVAAKPAGSPYPETVRAAFRRGLEIAVELQTLNDALRAANTAVRLSVSKTGQGFVVDGLPPLWSARLVPVARFWLLIVKRPTEPLATQEFATPFDAISALQAEIDPTVLLPAEEMFPPSPR